MCQIQIEGDLAAIPLARLDVAPGLCGEQDVACAAAPCEGTAKDAPHGRECVGESVAVGCFPLFKEISAVTNLRLGPIHSSAGHRPYKQARPALRFER
ncbi:hypothetical protein [Rhodococcus sp. C3V]|uniref:hypothetical protein n=1 Tax=Rhodococcus sp. C3V TaxID=3034165 RepID=UPI0023E17410|nr:hypothetical protein [Rhodococcus sp. C3V]MDF3320057.1 hypothetical protein [Rhodococcus sp. C3V]